MARFAIEKRVGPYAFTYMAGGAPSPRQFPPRHACYASNAYVTRFELIFATKSQFNRCRDNATRASDVYGNNRLWSEPENFARESGNRAQKGSANRSRSLARTAGAFQL